MYGISKNHWNRRVGSCSADHRRVFLNRARRGRNRQVLMIRELSPVAVRTMIRDRYRAPKIILQGRSIDSRDGKTRPRVLRCYQSFFREKSHASEVHASRTNTRRRIETFYARCFGVHSSSHANCKHYSYKTFEHGREFHQEKSVDLWIFIENK